MRVLIGAFFIIVKTDGSFAALVSMLASSSSPPTALWRVSFTVSHWSQLGVILDDPQPQKLPRATGNHGERVYKVFYFWQLLNTKLHFSSSI